MPCFQYVRMPCPHTQILILPPAHGQWAAHMYGQAPVEVDALQFFAHCLSAAKQGIDAGKGHGTHQDSNPSFYLPSAFVTFR